MIKRTERRRKISAWNSRGALFYAKLRKVLFLYLPFPFLLPPRYRFLHLLFFVSLSLSLLPLFGSFLSVLLLYLFLLLLSSSCLVFLLLLHLLASSCFCFLFFGSFFSCSLPLFRLLSFGTCPYCFGGTILFWIRNAWRYSSTNSVFFESPSYYRKRCN